MPQAGNFLLIKHIAGLPCAGWVGVKLSDAPSVPQSLGGMATGHRGSLSGGRVTQRVGMETLAQGPQAPFLEG